MSRVLLTQKEVSYFTAYSYEHYDLKPEGYLETLWNKSQDLQLVYTLYCLSTRFCLAWCKFAIIATNSTTLYASLNNSRKLISRKCGNKTGQLRVQIKACMCSLSEGQIQTVSFHCIFLWVFVKCIYDVCQEVDVRR